MTTSIPQPPGVPLLGNIFDVDPNNTWKSLNELAKKYGPIFKIRALGTQIVFIGSVPLLQEICDERRFRKCVTGPVVEIRHAVHDSLFTAYDHEASWGVAHRIMAPLLTREAIEAVFDGIQKTVSDLVSKWTTTATTTTTAAAAAETSGTGRRVHVTDDLDRLNIESCMKCFFDQEFQCLEGPEPAMIKAMAGATSEAMKRPVRPKLLNWLFFQRRFDKDTKTMRDFAEQIVSFRKANPTEKKDMLRALLEATDPETGESLNHSRVIDEIVTIFIGAATAPNLVAFALYYLMSNPQEIIRAREEIDAVVGRAGKVEHSHLARLKYCEAILREALRLSATAPGFNIEPLPSASADGGPVFLAGGQYEIPRDQAMIAILSAVNRDPAYFPDPETFRPERMLGDRYDRLPAACKKGFGNGKRECIGKVYAWQWSLYTLVSVLKDVDFKLADERYELHVNGAFSVKPLDLFALTGPRQ